MLTGICGYSEKIHRNSCKVLYFYRVCNFSKEIQRTQTIYALVYKTICDMTVDF